MGEPVKPAIIRTAEYTCKTKLRTIEGWTVTRQISGTTEAELEQRARALVKQIGGCYDVRFRGFLPTAEEAAAARKKAPTTIVTAQVTVKEDPCDGIFKDKPVCKK